MTDALIDQIAAMHRRQHSSVQLLAMLASEKAAVKRQEQHLRAVGRNALGVATLNALKDSQAAIARAVGLSSF